jgi:arylsulfatase A-like enzyme
LAGVEPDSRMQGVDLFNDAPREEVLFAHDSAHTAIVQQSRYAIRGFFDGRHKYARYYGVGGGKPTDDPFYKRPTQKLYDVDADFDDQDHEFYDLQEDPHELVNLAHDPARRSDLHASYARLKDLEATNF